MSSSEMMVKEKSKTEVSTADSLSADVVSLPIDEVDLSQFALRYETSDMVPTEAFGSKQQKLADLTTSLSRLVCRINIDLWRSDPEGFRALILEARERIAFARLQFVNMNAEIDINYPGFGWKMWCYFMLKAIFNRSYTQITTLKTLNHDKDREAAERVRDTLLQNVEKCSEKVSSVEDLVRTTVADEDRRKQEAISSAARRASEEELTRTKKEREVAELEQKENARKRTTKIKEALKGNETYQALVDLLATLKGDLELAAGVNWGNERDRYPNKLTEVYQRNLDKLPKISNYGDLPSVITNRLIQVVKDVHVQMKDIEEGVAIHLDLDNSQKE